jgi:prepilin peptidase CpaA
MQWHGLGGTLTESWHIWFVSVVLIIAAVIDGWKFKVPNWLTFPFIIGGWIFCTAHAGWAGLGGSLAGTLVGLALLFPAYAVGGMGAGDVKLLAGVGAWIGGTMTFFAFCFSAIAGGVIALAMVLLRRSWRQHWLQLQAIIQEFFIIRNPQQLAAIAAQRKSSMLLLPYGVPIAIGTIFYFIWLGTSP